ncbi:PAC2-like protein [Fusarium acuminatum]|uniref:PAC2-like protein n=1 Tax=Fusarium acuminatum TaxID=5515 RepID=A0ABZ2WJJ5_9HYPO
MTLRPQFFLVRPGAEQITATGQIRTQPATAVPLIPIDLLPEWVEVIGVPRSLSPEETKDMGNLGVVHSELDTFELRFAAITEDEPCDSDDSEESNVIQPSTISSGDTLVKPKPITSSSRLSPIPVPKGKLKPAQGLTSSRHNPDKQQQSAEVEQKWGVDCHYEHTMPTTATGLEEIGLSGFPDWWLQARGLMPMPPELLRLTDASSSRSSTTARKMMAQLRKKQKAKICVKREDIQLRNYNKASEAEDEYEEEEKMENEPKAKGKSEGVLIEFD